MKKNDRNKRLPSKDRPKLNAVKRVARHPAVAIPLATFSALMALTVLGLIVFNRDVSKLASADTRTAIVSHDDQEITVPTNAANVGELLNDLDINIHEGDVVEPGLDAQINVDTFRINVYRAAPVTIVEGDKKIFAVSAAATPRSIVKQAGIEVYPEDRLESVPTENFLLEGSIGGRVVIERATPVHLNLYGTSLVMRTHAKTVGGLLEERDVTIGDNETVRPKPETPITKNMQIFLLQKGTEIKTVEEEIAMPVEEVEDNSLSIGTRAIRQEGSPGKRAVTYQVQLENGKEVGRKQIQSVVIQEAVKQIEAVGTKPGDGLTKSKGVYFFKDSRGVVHRETYYDLPMGGVMGACGGGTYSVRSDGAKVDQDGYILVAAHLGNYPRCSVVETSLGAGKVYDTGGFVSHHPHGFDLATDWTNNDGR
jgi:uncharacterized protein YabE (DUF348 family)